MKIISKSSKMKISWLPISGEWLSFNAKLAICQLYHMVRTSYIQWNDENDDVHFILDQHV